MVLFPSQECYAAFQKTPAISVIHDLMHRYEVFPEVKDEYYAREQLYDSICNASVGIFVDSHVGKCQVIECYGKVHDSKVYVLPFTAPQYLYYECEKKPKQFLPEKYVFYPAQFWQHKNHINLIKAISLLKDNGTTAIFYNILYDDNNKMMGMLILEWQTPLFTEDLWVNADLPNIIAQDAAQLSMLINLQGPTIDSIEYEKENEQ